MSSDRSDGHEPIVMPGWPRPKGYSNGMLARPGRMLFVAGQVGWDERERIVSEEFVAQFDRALMNVVEIVREAGGQPEDICRFTIYVVDRFQYIAGAPQIGAKYRERMGKHFPAMALVQVAALLEEGAKVEIEATAVIPDERGTREGEKR